MPNKTNAPAPHAHPETKEDLQKHWWKHPRAKIVGGLTLAVALVAFVGWFFLFAPYLSTDDARVASTTVRVAPAGAGGQIVKLNVSEGDRVTAGQVLVELDHRTSQAQLQRAQARLVLSEKELRRMEQMAAENGVAPRDLDSARANHQTMEADVKLAEIALDNTYMRSPLDGVVIQKSTEIGNMLEPGQTAVSITDMDHAWVSANIEETSVGRVKVGQPVTITVDEGGTYYGKVSEIRAATAAQFALIPADNPSGNFTKLVQRIPVKIALDPSNGRTLRVGQSVEVKIKTR
jgi:membrane fusion protein (multidrug efflux system)